MFHGLWTNDPSTESSGFTVGKDSFPAFCLIWFDLVRDFIFIREILGGLYPVGPSVNSQCLYDPIYNYRETFMYPNVQTVWEAYHAGTLI